MYRASESYSRYKGKACWKNHETYLNGADVVRFLKIRAEIHAKHGRQLQADEDRAIAEILELALK